MAGIRRSRDGGHYITVWPCTPHYTSYQVSLMCVSCRRGLTTFDAVFNDVLKMASVHYVHVWVSKWRESKARRTVRTQKGCSSLFDLAVVQVISMQRVQQ